MEAWGPRARPRSLQRQRLRVQHLPRQLVVAPSHLRAGQAPGHREPHQWLVLDRLLPAERVRAPRILPVGVRWGVPAGRDSEGRDLSEYPAAAWHAGVRHAGRAGRATRCRGSAKSSGEPRGSGLSRPGSVLDRRPPVCLSAHPSVHRPRARRARPRLRALSRLGLAASLWRRRGVAVGSAAACALRGFRRGERRAQGVATPRAPRRDGGPRRHGDRKRAKARTSAAGSAAALARPGGPPPLLHWRAGRVEGGGGSCGEGPSQRPSTDPLSLGPLPDGEGMEEAHRARRVGEVLSSGKGG